MSSGEVRSVSSSGGEKGVKPQSMSYLPVDSLMLIAEHFHTGSEKYSKDNWRKGYEWSKSYDAMQRHLMLWWSGEDYDNGPGGTGNHHLQAVGFHALTLLNYTHNDKYAEFDDRYKG